MIRGHFIRRNYMLTTLMNEGANKWRKDKKRTYFLIDEA